MDLLCSKYREGEIRLPKPKAEEQHGVREEDLPTLLAVHVAPHSAGQGGKSGLGCWTKFGKQLLATDIARNLVSPLITVDMTYLEVA